MGTVVQTVENSYQPTGLHDAFLDFILSRKGMLCTNRTIDFYKFTLLKFIDFLQPLGIFGTNQVTARHVRAFLNVYREKGSKDSYIHSFARAIKTFLTFLYQEGYRKDLVRFDMPRVEQKKLPVLSSDQVVKVIKTCGSQRDLSVFLLMVDTGLRLAEASDLQWGEIDLQSGVCLVKRGKGKMFRTVVLGVRTRRALAKYKLGLRQSDDNQPVFQTQLGHRLSKLGLNSMLKRLSKNSGIRFSAHALRRTFVVLSLRAGMSLAHVQALMGHKTPVMTLRYAQLEENDLIEAHQLHGAVDTLPRQ